VEHANEDDYKRVSSKLGAREGGGGDGDESLEEARELQGLSSLRGSDDLVASRLREQQQRQVCVARNVCVCVCVCVCVMPSRWEVFIIVLWHAVVVRHAHAHKDARSHTCTHICRCYSIASTICAYANLT